MAMIEGCPVSTSMSEGQDVSQPFTWGLILQELSTNGDTAQVLLRYLACAEKDARLLDIYQEIGFSPSRKTFIRTPQRDIAISHLSRGAVFTDDFLTEDYQEEPYDVHRALKTELGKTFAATGFLEIENSSELIDYQENLDQPLCSMWKEDEFSTPQACKFRGDSTTPRSSRGLKRLSQRVKEVVQERTASTYKDVADDLIKELDQLDIADKDKEEKNIRRRVYDALNVLIAAGVIAKRGKQVMWRGADPGFPPLTEGLEDVQINVFRKRKKLQEIVEQWTALQALMERNQRKPARDRVALPCSIVTCPGRSEVTVSGQGREMTVSVRAQEPVQVVDCERYIGMLKLTKTDNVPEELKELLAGGNR